MARIADAVVVGAGIAGVASAHALIRSGTFEQVVVVDPRAPLTLTSDKSTECYRNHWPTRSMVSLMNRSIDLLDQYASETNNIFGLNRRGYLYLTKEPSRLASLIDSATVSSGFGAGPVRVHANPREYGPATDGFDVLEGAGTVLDRFPYLNQNIVGAVHVRRAGWFSAQQLGAWMLDEARKRGAALVRDEVVHIEVRGGAVSGVRLTSGETISAPIVVIAAGPMSDHVANMAGVELPVFSELHLKVAFRDHQRVIPRSAPMMIWSDPQAIDWDDEERQELESAGRDDLLAEMPAFCHGRPEGGEDSPYLVALWEYHNDVREPVWPIPQDPLYPEAVIRGMTTMVPGLSAYKQGLPRWVVDGGYYTKTGENRPLIGPAGPEGLHLIAALSGFGVMVAAGAADLLASHISGGTLAPYAADFLLSRYQDEGSARHLSPETGQL